MFAAYPGDIVFSKIDARNGAIGILPPEIPQAIVTAEFPVFIVDAAQLEGEFVTLVLRTGTFIESLRQRASGTSGRKRIKPDAFCDLRIPLPSLSEQGKIVAAHRAASVRAGDSSRTAAQPRSASQVPDASVREVSEVVYGLQKHPGNRPGRNARPYLRVANVQRGQLMLDEIRFIDVTPADSGRLCLKDRDLLFVEGNGSRENLGRVAIWRNEIPNCIHQNHLIRARVDEQQVFPDFAAHWFNSASGRLHFFEHGKTTSGFGTINSRVVRSAPIPLPPVDVQIALATSLQDDLILVAELRRQAERERSKARADFEAAVYATEGDGGERSAN